MAKPRGLKVRSNAPKIGDSRFCQALASIRDKRGLTMIDLAEKTGIHRESLYRLYRGDIPDPTLATLEQLADGLGVTLDELAGRKPLRR